MHSLRVAKVNCAGFNNFLLYCVRLTSTRHRQQILCYVASNCIAAESIPGAETPQSTSPSITDHYLGQAGHSLWNVSTSVRLHLLPCRGLTWGQQQSGRASPPSLVTPAHQCSTECFKYYPISSSSNWRRHQRMRADSVVC